MSKQIITQDPGKVHFSYETNIQNRVLKENISAPMSLKQSKARANSILKSKIQNNHGSLLTNTFPEYVAQDDWINNKGQLIQLASISNGKLVANPAAISQFSKYPNNQISFVGNYGRKDAGKSFWYDKILNLSGFDGNHYSNNVNKEPGLYFWNIPFTKGDLKFYLIDFIGYKTNDVLSEGQRKLLDFQLLLSQKFVVIPEPNDNNLTILRSAYDHLLQSQKRFSNKEIKLQKFSPYWPQEIYTLYRTSNPVKKQIQKIGILFEVYNFSIIHDALKDKSLDKSQLLKTDLNSNVKLDIINPKYVKMTSIVFKDIYEHMHGKSYGSIRANGKNIGFLMDQSLQSINNGNIRKMDDILKNVGGDIYADAVAKSKFIYLSKVNHIIKDPKPRSIDQLTDTFQVGNRAAFQEFDKQKLDPKKHEEHERRLQNEINKIEDEILEQNKIKTYNYYNKKIPVQAVHNKNDLEQLKASFMREKTQTSLDHDDTIILEEKLKKIHPENANGEEIFLPNSIKKRQNELKRLLQTRKNQLYQINKQAGSLKGGITAPQIVTTTTIPSNSIIGGQQELSHDQFDLVLNILRQKHQQNDLQISQLKAKTFAHPEISKIKERLHEVNTRNSQIQAGLSQLDKTTLSNNKSKSIIREIKEENNIKKVVKK